MNLERTIRSGLSEFNERQEATKRKPLTNIEGTMLMTILRAALADEMGLLRSDLEFAASQASVEAKNDLDWATDIIISFIRGENRTSVTLEDEKVRKLSAGFELRVERGEGRTELELSQSNE